MESFSLREFIDNPRLERTRSLQCARHFPACARPFTPAGRRRYVVSAGLASALYASTPVSLDRQFNRGEPNNTDREHPQPGDALIVVVSVGLVVDAPVIEASPRLVENDGRAECPQEDRHEDL